MLIDEQIAQTVEADLTGPRRAICRRRHHPARRGRSSGAAVSPAAGSISSPPMPASRSPAMSRACPPGVLAQPGLVETDYLRAGDKLTRHRAVAARLSCCRAVSACSSVTTSRRASGLRHIIGSALITSLDLARAHRHRRRALGRAPRPAPRRYHQREGAAPIVGGDLSGRLPLAGTGDELDRLVENLNSMLDRIAVLMGGMKRSLRQYRA